MSFSGQHCAVTGGGSGIGLGIATHFCRLGASVAILDMSTKALDSGEKEIKAAVPGAVVLKGGSTVHLNCTRTRTVVTCVMSYIPYSRTAVQYRYSTFAE